MAIIHRTTMTPTKLELLATWLPTRPWYLPTGRAPELGRAGGFRLDDPDGAVGIEFMVVTDGTGEPATAYHVPLTYRGAPCDEAADGLIGTAEHGVLGRRWIYDGAHDPVLVAQLVALVQGTAQPQAQSVSDAPDPSVHSRPLDPGCLVVTGLGTVTDGEESTDIALDAAADDGSPGRPLTVHVNRILRAHGAPELQPGAVSATWLLPDGTRARGPVATAAWWPLPPGSHCRLVATASW